MERRVLFPSAALSDSSGSDSPRRPSDSAVFSVGSWAGGYYGVLP